ncbi:hypothetical protein M407DRAFT_26754 [Tulasnella calospora MUT 4182]|uniref:DUF7918 domain-containing protein n=1 Tax=Tulasnella calospora MUT 4182 TaxID=1051891 RepID=A0A0C3Q4H3_9AGAM|nr:hypothetical protein M407DRAFT_26754 [Tulasnella calospora MUT 4182]
MLYFRSYKVSIRVNGQDVPVYQPENDEDTKTATGWIASEQHQRFAIFCQQDETFNYTTSARVYLDGSKESSHRGLIGEGRLYSNCIEGVWDSPTSLRPFVFESVKTTDDDAYLNHSLDRKAPGTIRVEMHRVRVLSRPEAWQPSHAPKPAPTVHERSKKAGGHVTRLGKQEAPARLPKWLSSKPYSPSDTEPWVSFEFRYRPAAILQAEGIMPKLQARRSETQSLGEDEEVEAEHKAEILALEAEQAALDARRTALKAKFGNLNVKREASPIRVPQSAVTNVIDLTLEYVQICS